MKIKLTFKETPRPDGPSRTFEITDGMIRPLGYDDLLVVGSNRGTTIPIDFPAARIDAPDFPRLHEAGIARVTAHLTSDYASKAISIVPGGWLPSAWSMMNGNPLVLLDRNLISEITGRFRDGRTVGRRADFIDLIVGQKVRISPILSVLEGNKRAPPSFETMRAQLDEIVSKLRSALPVADIITTSETLSGLWGLLEGSRSEMAMMLAFLIKAVPRVAAPVARNRVESVWNEIVGIAHDHGVPLTSLAVICVLSAASSRNGTGPAKRLLKARSNYSTADAYNALCDLRSLDLLITVAAKFPAERAQICTADRDLALFWCSLDLCNVRAEAGEITYEITPHPALFSSTALDRLNEIHGRESIASG